jgi:hypothetical protein
MKIPTDLTATSDRVAKALPELVDALRRISTIGVNHPDSAEAVMALQEAWIDYGQASMEFHNRVAAVYGELNAALGMKV